MYKTSGANIVVSMANYAPMTIQMENGTYYGISMEILHSMEKEMNITYDTVTTPDGNWGSRNEDGSWNGFVGQLMDGGADICLSGACSAFFIHPYDWLTAFFSIPPV